MRDGHKEEEKPRTTLERQWKLWSQGRMIVMEISFGGLEGWAGYM